MIVAFVLCLSTATPTTFNVGVKDVWTGLVDVFDMNRTNLLDERLIKRKSGGAIVNYLRNEYNVVSFADESFDDVHTESTFAYGHSVDTANERVQFYLSNEPERANSEGLSKVPTALSNMGGMLKLSTTERFRYSHETIIRICSSVSGDVQHGPLVVFALQHLLSPSMDSGDDPLHAQRTQAISTVALLVSFMTMRTVCALEDHVTWSSRTSLVTLMSGA